MFALQPCDLRAQFFQLMEWRSTVVTMRSSPTASLQEEVYAHPHDDRLREALARALREEGDEERAWFIAAQLLEAKGLLPLAEFEQLVEREAKVPGKWLGPLSSQVVMSRSSALRSVFRRGLPSRVFPIASSVDTGSPAWSTIECVTPGASTDWLLEVKWKSLKELREVPVSLLRRWAESGRAPLETALVRVDEAPSPAALLAARSVQLLGANGELFEAFTPWFAGVGVTALSAHSGVAAIARLLERVDDFPPHLERVGVSVRTATGDFDGWELWLARDTSARLLRLTARLHPPARERDRPRHIKLADELFSLIDFLQPGALSRLEVEIEAGYRDSFFRLLETDRAQSVSVAVRERWGEACRNRRPTET